MKIVSNQSSEEIRRQRLKEDAQRAFCQLIGETMRVIAKAGQPYMLRKLLIHAVSALVEYENLYDPDRERPAQVLAEPDYLDARPRLARSEDPKSQKREWEEIAVAQAEWAIQMGALRIIAAELLGGNPVVQRNAENLFYDAIARHEKARDEYRKKRSR